MPLKLEGMDELIAKIDKLADADKAKEKALDAGAEYMRKKIADNTPRSTVSGDHAADHIIVAKKGDRREIGPDKGHFYLKYPEFGTSKQPAQGFMSRTFHAEVGKARKIMAAELRKELGL